MNIDDLISQYIDGELPPEAEAELHHRLSISDEDRRIFREQIMLTGLARDERVLDKPGPSLRSALFARLHREEGMQSAAIPHDTAFAHLAAPVPGATGRRSSPSRRRRMVAVLLPLLVAALGTSLVLVLDEDPGTSTRVSSERVQREESRQEEPVSGPSAETPLADGGGRSLAARSESEPAGSGEGTAILSERARGEGSSRSSDSRREDALAMSLDEAPPESRPMATAAAPEFRTLGGRDGETERATDRFAPPPQPVEVPSSPAKQLTTSAPDRRDGALPPAALSATEPSRAPTETRRSRLALISGIQQHVLIGMEDDHLRPELTVRLGGAFADGDHSIFGIVGYAGYSETTTQSRLRLQNNVYRGTDSIQEDTQEIDDRGELWGGAGYRFSARLGDHWRVGAGAWAGFGQRFSRVAAELPVTYVIGRTVSVELTPSVVLVTARENAARERAFERVATPDAIVVQTETVTVPESELRTGIGLGITITID